VRQLPLLNDLYDQSLKTGQFTIISVAVDGPNTMPRLRGLLKEYHIRYPVLHYLDGDTGGTFDWNIEFLSTNVLIDPQGVIVDDIWVQESFPELLACLADPACAVPRLAIDISKELRDDHSVTANITIANPAHTPLNVNYGGFWEYYDPEREMEDMDWDGQDQLTRLVEFGEFGEDSLEVDFPARDGIERFYCWVETRYPGTEAFYDGEGLACIQDYNVWFDEDGQVEEF